MTVFDYNFNCTYIISMYNLTHAIFDVVYTNHHSFSNGLELVL